MKYRMHILDGPSGLSPRAQSLLARTGWREKPQGSQIPTEYLRARDGRGRLVSPPMLLVIRREGFSLGYAGLRYRVRHGFTVSGQHHECAYDWIYDLDECLWVNDSGGGYFDWFGERVSSPVHFLMHTDGRVGVEDGNTVFLEIAPSIHALIESHALTDEVSTWDRGPSSTDDFELARHLRGLQDIPEASGPTVRWRLSDQVAVQEFRNWSSTDRRWRAFIWCRGRDGHRRVEEAAEACTNDRRPVVAA